MKKKNERLPLKTIVALGFFLLGMRMPVWAEEVSLAISPPLVEVMIQPGKSITQAYEIINNSQIDLYLRARVLPFVPADSQGGISLELKEGQLEGENYFSLANADLILGQTFKLSANSQKQLVLKISPPATAPEGDYYYTLLIEQSPEGRFLGQTGSQQLISLGSNLLLTISQSGQPKKQAMIEKFFAQPKLADLFHSVNFRLLIRNVGQAYFKPVGKIEIYHQLTRKKVTELELRPDNILVNSNRVIICSDGPCSFRSWQPGKYQAEVSVSPDGQGESIRASTSFWIMPIKAIGLILLLGFFLFLTKRKIFLTLDKEKNIS